MAQNEDYGYEAMKSSRGGKKKAERIRNLWVNASGGRRRDWQFREQKAYDFFLNSQLTEEEEIDLKEAGMPTFIINRMTPVLETMKYFVTANSPRWKAIGREGSDAKIASIHTDMIDYSWYISDGKQVFSNIVLDALVKSKGYMHIYVDPDADRGLGEVKFERVDPFHVYVASMTTDPFERNAAYHIIKKDLPRQVLKTKLPAFRNKITRASGEMDDSFFSARDIETSDSIQPEDVENQLQPDGTQDDILPYYEVYEPVPTKYWNVFVRISPSTKDLEETKTVIDGTIADMRRELQVEFLELQGELQRQLESGAIIKQRYDLEIEKAQKQMEQTLADRRQTMINQAQDEASKVEQRVVAEDEIGQLEKLPNVEILQKIEFYENRYKKSCVVGDQFLYEIFLDTQWCPLIALPYMHTGTPFPMSAARPLIGKQQEINKAHQIMVHNANLASNLRWLYVEGEVDEDLWAKYSASPSALLPYRPGMSQTGPREIMPQNINNAFFTIEQDSKSDLEYMAGIHAPSMGMSSGSDETYRGFLAKDEYGTRRVRSWVANVMEPFLEHVGKVYHEIAKSVYTVHKVFRIVQPNPTGEFEERTAEINVPIFADNGDVIGRYNDYATSRYDIRITAGSTLPVNRWAILEEYKQYLELGIIDDIAFLAETDIKNKEDILARKSIYQQLQSQLSQLEEALKDRDGTIETLSRQLIQAGILNQVRSAEQEIDRAKTESKMQAKLQQERMRDDLKLMREKMKMEQNRAKSSSKKSEK